MRVGAIFTILGTGELYARSVFVLMFVKDSSFATKAHSILKSVASRFHKQLVPVLVKSSQVNALKFFGVTDKDLPACIMFHLEPQGAARMQKKKFAKTCAPYCTIDFFQNYTNIEDTDVLEFVERWFNAHPSLSLNLILSIHFFCCSNPYQRP